MRKVSFSCQDVSAPGDWLMKSFRFCSSYINFMQKIQKVANLEFSSERTHWIINNSTTGGNSHMKRLEMLVGKFESKP